MGWDRTYIRSLEEIKMLIINEFGGGCRNTGIFKSEIRGKGLRESKKIKKIIEK